jgi:hypothetical protein
MSFVVILNDYRLWREVCIASCDNAISVRKTAAEFSTILSHMEMPPKRAELYSSDLTEPALVSEIAKSGIVFYERGGSYQAWKYMDYMHEAKSQVQFDSLQSILKRCGRLLASFELKRDA